MVKVLNVVLVLIYFCLNFTCNECTVIYYIINIFKEEGQMARRNIASIQNKTCMAHMNPWFTTMILQHRTNILHVRQQQHMSLCFITMTTLNTTLG